MLDREKYKTRSIFLQDWLGLPWHQKDIYFVQPRSFFLYTITNMSATDQVVVDTPIEGPSGDTPELSNDEPMETPVKEKRAYRKKTILQTEDPNVEIEVKSRKPGPK